MIDGHGGTPRWILFFRHCLANVRHMCYVYFHCQKFERLPVSKPSEPSVPAPADDAPAAGLAAVSAARLAGQARRRERAERIIGRLNHGASVADIAEAEGVSLKRMRNCLREILAEREPQPPVPILAEAKRLNEALGDALDAMHDPMTGANFKAIDRVVSIVRALDLVNGLDAPSLRRCARRRLPRMQRGPRAPQRALERPTNSAVND